MPDKPDVLTALESAYASLTHAMAGQGSSASDRGFAAICAKLIRRLTQLSEAPLVRATVLSVLDAGAVADPKVTIATGLQVRVLKSERFPTTIGLIGTAINDAQDGGAIYVLFPDGSYGSYQAALAEIEVVCSKRRLIIMLDGRMLEIPTPDALTIEAGQSVWLTGDTYQVIKAGPVSLTGAVVTVERVLIDHRAEVSFTGDRRVVAVAANVESLEIGHRTILDPSGWVIVASLGHDDGLFQPTTFTPVSWDEIGGYETIKRQIRKIIEGALEPTPLQSAYGVKPVRGFLLEGPGGVGKTRYALACYTALLAKHRAVANGQVGYFYIRGPEVLESLVGQAEKKLLRVAKRADEFWKKTGLPPMVVIDEVDAIAKKRGTGISSDVNDTLVTTLLNVMSGFEESGIIWVFLTNRVDVLDPELIRPGRIDRIFNIPRPDQSSAEAIFRVHLMPMPLQNMSPTEMAKSAAEYYFGDDVTLYDLTFAGEKNGQTIRHFTVANIGSGAMIANAVQRAAELAMDRDEAAQLTKPAGIRLEDITSALLDIRDERLRLNHDDILEVFVNNFTDRLVKSERRLRQVMQ